MKPAIILNYKKIPMLFFLRAPFYGLWGQSSVFQGKESIPAISVSVEGMKIDKAHLSGFNEICDVTDRDEISLIYPITLVFPFFQKILSMKQAPLSMFNTLGKHLKISRYRQIGVDESLDIVCEISDLHLVPKGLELVLNAVIKAAGEVVWTATETFFYRGDFGDPDTNVENIAFEPIPHAKVIAKWFLPGGNGFRFARISGDGNGIHYSKLYARLFGFKRDFAQPFLILGSAIRHVIDNDDRNVPISLSVAIKGQFYYEKDVVIKGAQMHGANRFDIYSQGNERPCMSGIVYADNS